MEKRREGNGVDRISELPEPILHHIQSLLFIKEAARTSALSKTWNTVWTTLPFLNFDNNYFLPRHLCHRKDIEANYKKLIAFIDKTLDHRRSQGLRIEKFVLYGALEGYSLDHTRDLSGHLDRWIGCLTVCNIDELIIQYYDSSSISLPQSLFTIESLTSLSLKFSQLPCLAIEQVKLPNLRKLCLEFVYIDEQLLCHFIRNCHRLEYLRLVCFKHHPLQISGVEAWNIGHRPKINPAYCGSTLKCLKLYKVSVKDDAWFSHLILNLPVLETLSLKEVDHNALRISTPSLKHLCLCRPKTAFEAKIDAPNLLSFRYEGELLKLSLNNNLAVDQVEIRISNNNIDGDKSVKLIQLLRKFDHSQVVKLLTTYFEISSEIREKLDSPLPNVKRFICWRYIPSSTPQLIDAVSQVLDGSFWLSSCLEYLFISVHSTGYYHEWQNYSYFENNSESFIISLKMLYEDELKDGIENKSCCHCNSIPFRCWRHSLKTVEIEKTRGSGRIDDAVRSIKSYFMANLCSRAKSNVSQLFIEKQADDILFRDHMRRSYRQL